MKDYEKVIALWQSCEGIGISGADSKDSMEAYLKRNPVLKTFMIRSDDPLFIRG
jgi:hypothetical protein